MNGLLVIDKPTGMTSRDVVNRVQRWFPRKTKIGHTGTLDPLATGVLVVCIGAATRLADYVQAMGKSYNSRFRFGATSTTDDADGIVTEAPTAMPPTRAQIESVLRSFVGTIEQVPPAFSALKVDGQRAYDLARSGKEAELAARPVRIDAIRLVDYDWPFADVEVDCGKGTYIRSIARDVGDMLGCGGLVQTLRRTRIGPYLVEDAVTLDLDPAAVNDDLRPMCSAIGYLPEVRIASEALLRFQHGQSVSYVASQPVDVGSEVAVKSGFEEVVGVGVAQANAIVKPVIVFRL